MSKITMLRLLITQRLTAAAEEIFSVFGQTIAELEDEISRVRLESARNRRRAELSARPQVVLRGGGAQSGGGATGGVSEQDFNSCSSIDVDAALKEETDFFHVKEEGEEEEEDDDQHKDLGAEQREDVPPIPEHQPSLFHSISVTHRDDHLTTTALHPQPGTSAPPSYCDLDEPTKRRRLGAPLSQVLDSYVCTICGRVFAHRAHWAKHVQVHRKSLGNSEKSYTCDICGKKLTRLDGYQKHRRVHTGEKPYTCGQCGRSFSDNSNYKRHVRTHTGQRTSQS